MQYKYLSKIKDIYDNFNVTVMPLQDEEAHSKLKLIQF
jgi:hypothetical protein